MEAGATATVAVYTRVGATLPRSLRSANTNALLGNGLVLCGEFSVMFLVSAATSAHIQQMFFNSSSSSSSPSDSKGDDALSSHGDTEGSHSTTALPTPRGTTSASHLGAIFFGKKDTGLKLKPATTGSATSSSSSSASGKSKPPSQSSCSNNSSGTSETIPLAMGYTRLAVEFVYTPIRVQQTVVDAGTVRPYVPASIFLTIENLSDADGVPFRVENLAPWMKFINLSSEAGLSNREIEDITASSIEGLDPSKHFWLKRKVKDSRGGRSGRGGLIKAVAADTGSMEDERSSMGSDVTNRGRGIELSSSGCSAIRGEWHDDQVSTVCAPPLKGQSSGNGTGRSNGSGSESGCGCGSSRNSEVDADHDDSNNSIGSVSCHSSRSNSNSNSRNISGSSSDAETSSSCSCSASDDSLVVTRGTILPVTQRHLSHALGRLNVHGKSTSPILYVPSRCELST